MILKNTLLFTLLFCCQSYLVFGHNAESVCPEPIKVGFNDWAPYSWIDASGHAVGLDIDILTLVANNLGCQIHFINMPIKRAHQMLKAGTLDMMMGASYTKEREKYAFFTQSYRKEEIRLFTKADSLPQISVDKWQDIFSQKLKLLAPTYGWYGKDYLQSKAELQNQGLLVISQDAAQSVRMLAYKRGDILIGDSISLPYIANQSEGLALAPLPLIVNTNKIHFMLSKQTKKPALLQEMNNAISTLSNHGALAKVVNKWQNISVAQTPAPAKTPTMIDSNGAFNYTGQGLLSR
ncbi:substrate-binding periplasmic protein [Shewanella sp. OMA3-2]|uniref:substrate-binding periplasmic protein n=1 Tax=Shewanella sp. OMA3-2 TaxID=2908650 RepID=UPI001F407E2F|nr:transporter substrate-binding domain-containing protein [Shewanella sp. OMA3-2]UJF23469.1 transporter substrate-binding domain-containing protein [Shewanella sp. OMA3-2]